MLIVSSIYTMSILYINKTTNIVTRYYKIHI